MKATFVLDSDSPLFQPLKLSWDTDLINYLGTFKLHFINAKLLGLCGFPHELLQAQVSTFDRYRARVICVLSVVTSLQVVASLWMPQTFPNVFVSLGNDNRGNPLRYFLPLFTSTIMILKVRTALLLSDRVYLKDLRGIVYEITQNPVLNKLRVSSWKVQASFIPATSSTIVIIICFVLTQESFAPGSWRFFHFYNTMLNGVLHGTVYSYLTSFVIAISHFVVLPMLTMTVRQFEDATETMDVVKLGEAIRSHETCCRLIACVDRIASWFIGTTLALAVPHIAITFSNFGSSLDVQNKTYFWQLIVFFIGSAMSITTTMYLASAIHQEAHKPAEILSSSVFENKIFDRLSSGFTRRFQSKVYGYTFFGFLTFRKQTVLSVLNIITTYLIVAMQFNIQTVK